MEDGLQQFAKNDEIFEMVAILGFYGPIGVGRIIKVMEKAVSRATVLRRLKEMEIHGLVACHGKARATRYALTAAGHASAGDTPALPSRVQSSFAWEEAVESYGATARVEEPGVDDLPQYRGPADDALAAAERERLRALLRVPVSRRPRVEYHRDFLDEYEPNRSFYLPAPLREELRAVGQSDNMARLPAGTYVRSVFQRVLIDLAWNSSRLEGNTYSLLETDRLLALGRGTDPARTLEARMILNHKEAIEFFVDAPDDIGFNRYTVLNLHALLAHELLAESYDEGRLRRIGVGIGGSRYLPLDIPQVIEECFMRILEKAAAIHDPLEAAFFSMVHLPYLQPFVDVNKRVSRLAANIPLIKENLAPLTFVDVPLRDYTDAILAVYELNRVELLRDVFARAYRASAARYGEVRSGIKPPEEMSLRYHEALRTVAREVVQGKMDKAVAAEHIRRWSQANVPIQERPRVVEMAERSLLSLHEGNFAKFRLRPSEFSLWHSVWLAGEPPAR